MANTPKKLYHGQPATTVGTLYTVPASTKAIVKNISLTNTTASAATIDLHFVASGGTAGVANKILSAYSIAAGDTVVIDMAGVLETGDTVQGLQATAGAISVYISGIEVA